MPGTTLDDVIVATAVETESKQAANLEANLADATLSLAVPTSSTAASALLPCDEELDLCPQESRRWLASHLNLFLPSRMALVLPKTAFTHDTSCPPAPVHDCRRRSLSCFSTNLTHLS